MDLPRFRRLVAVVLASPVVAVVAPACGGEKAATRMPEQALCIDPASDGRYTTLTVAPGIDGILFSTSSGDYDATTQVYTRTTRPLTPLGTPCGGAVDRAACETRANGYLAHALVEGAGWSVMVSRCLGFCDREFVRDVAIITAGDDVHTATFEDVLRAVSPVATKEAAVALLMLQNRYVDCNENNVRPDGDGWVFRFTASSCSGRKVEHFTRVSRDGVVSDAGENVLSDSDNGCIEGRRPAGLRPTGSPWLSNVGPCLAEIAHMEAAAVAAFVDLAERLHAAGAPADLLARIERARRDEVRHAAITKRLAESYGGIVCAPKVDAILPASGRSALALENAVEGCVREAFGALVAAFQAANASDPAIRLAFASIAKDEAQHAELSFAIDAWVVTPAMRAEVDAAMASAWTQLATELAEPAPDVRRVVGYPTLAEQHALLAALRDVALAA